MRLRRKTVSDYYHDDPDEPLRPKRNRSSFLALLVLFAGGGFYLQSTLAANISVNSGVSTEFGQGITQTITCAGSPADLKITPTSKFVNVSGSGSHYLKSIRVDGIPSACKGVDFSLSGFDDSSSSALTLFDATTIAAKKVTITMTSGSAFLPVNSGDITVTTNSSSSFTASLDSPAALSTSVAKVTIQSTTHNSTAGIAWTSRTANNGGLGIAYGNGLFVAVLNIGSGDRVMTSPDGITWTSRTSYVAANNDWYSVTYGNGLFVAVGSLGCVMTSPDGITWTSRASPANYFWSSVTYGNGIFVAVSVQGNGDRVMTSPDGSTWTLRTSAADNNWYGVTYGDGIFVAVAKSAANIAADKGVMTSPNGINWTLRTTPADNYWQNVTYGNGIFVAVSLGGIGNCVMTSPDGITWTSRASAADNKWYGIAYGNGLFVAVSYDGTGNQVMTSPDGITWSSRNSGLDNFWFNIAYGNGVFVAITNSGSGNRVMTSN